MRILLLAQFFPPDIGGEERHVFNLANTLAGRGHEVAVATQRMADVPDQETLTSGVRVHRFATAAMRLPGVYSSSRTHHPPLPDPLGVRELSRITRQERPHVVHAHNWIVNSALALRRSSPTGSRFGLVLTLHDFSHVCATKRLMRMGSPCEGPAVARCLPCATAHYGPAVGPLTAGATALMRPWKNRAIDHVVCVSNAVARGNHIRRGQNTSIIPNFVLDEDVLDRAGGAAEKGKETPNRTGQRHGIFQGCSGLHQRNDALDGRSEGGKTLPDSFFTAGRAYRSRSGMRRLRTESIWKGRTTSRSKALPSTTCRAPAFARC